MPDRNVGPKRCAGQPLAICTMADPDGGRIDLGLVRDLPVVAAAGHFHRLLRSKPTCRIGRRGSVIIGSDARNVNVSSDGSGSTWWLAIETPDDQPQARRGVAERHRWPAVLHRPRRAAIGPESFGSSSRRRVSGRSIRAPFRLRQDALRPSSFYHRCI
jgi:hypothetical protein